MKREYNSLPRELSAKFLAAERKDGRVATLLAIVGLLFALGAVFLPFLAAERLWATPGWLRGGFLLVALVGSGWFVVQWVGHRLRCRRDPFVTVRRIERHYPGLGDSLRGVIELAADGDVREGISESLRQAAVRQVSQQCQPLNFTEAISTSRVWTYGKRVGAVVLVLVACGLVEPQLVRNAIARFARPWAPIPRYTFAQLIPLPTTLQVARGESFTLAVRVAEDSRWCPDQVRFRLGRAATKSSPVAAGEALLELPGITESSSLRLRFGDTSAVVRIEPVPRPALLELVGDVALPAYLERAGETVECARQRVRLVEGSVVVLRGTVLNPLHQAWVGEGEATTACQVAGRGFVSPPLAAESLLAASLHWLDTHGLTPAEPYRAEIEVVPDAPPSVQFEGGTRVAAILEHEVLDLALRSGDDFGIKQVEAAWDVFPADKPEDAPTDSGRRLVGAGAPDRTEWDGSFAFSPKRLGILAGTRVVIRARAADYKPGRAYSESAPFVVFVLTPEDHARLVQSQLEALRNRMEEAALREAQQLFDNEQLAKLTNEELRQPDAQRELDKQADLERKSVEDWQRLTEEGAKLLAEATRNDTFPAEALREWTETMEAVRGVSGELLPQAAGALAQASQSPTQRRERVEQAIEAQRKALEALKKSAEKMGESLEQFAVLNMAARLRALADRERGVSGALQELFPQTIGMTAEALPALLGNRVRGLTETQSGIQKLTFGIQFEVQRCLENTGIEKYGKVVEAMEQAKLTDEMPAAANAIAGNRLAQAVGEVQRWATSLDEWAALLDEKKDGGGGGGGGGEMSPEAMEFMLALLRAIQSQEQLRRDTVGLDAEKEQIADYPQQAERLSVAESELSRTVGDLAKKLRPSDARNNIEDAQGLMEQVAITMREPETGREVQADMSSAMELLLSLFDSNCQGGQCQGASMMAMMAQKLGLQMRLGAGAGAAGGGSRAGGPFGGAGGTVTGGAGSGGAAARAGDSVTDVAPAEFPAEYRGLLERFFRNVEAAHE